MLGPKDDNLDDWLHLMEETHEALADVYVIGLQEVPYDPGSLILDYYIRNDPWSKRLMLFLSSKGIVVFASARMMGLLLLVAAKPLHLPHLREVRSTYTRTALYGLLGTKGAVSVRFDLYGESFCFVNNHFIAGDAYYEQRNHMYDLVMKKTLFQNCDKSQILDNRYVLFFGDFNYRIDNLDNASVKALIAAGDVSKLLEDDQMLRCIREEKGFEGFCEASVTFAPTYKFDVNTSTYDTLSKLPRKPAFCDRILLREQVGAEQQPSWSQHSYQSHPQYISSDHKPISAEVIVSIPQSVTSLPVVEFRFDPSFIPWTSDEDGVCIFHVKDYQTSSWDWVGLYTLDFKNPRDYYTYEWSVSGADETGENGCMVLFDDVPEEPGYYMFGYWSRKMECFLGLSDPFHVIPQQDEPQEVTVEVPPETEPALSE